MSMEFLDRIKEQIPDYAKDIRLNLDGVIGRSSLAPEDALGVALASAYAARSKPLIDAFRAAAPEALGPPRITIVSTADARLRVDRLRAAIGVRVDRRVPARRAVRIAASPRRPGLGATTPRGFQSTPRPGGGRSRG